jgi:hypothetical protein
MSIDDALQQSIVRLTQQTELLVQNEIANAALAGIPFIGGSISALMTDLARRRLVERTVELAEAMKERIAEIDESKIDVDFFRSEAFQTLVAQVSKPKSARARALPRPSPVSSKSLA